MKVGGDRGEFLVASLLLAPHLPLAKSNWCTPWPLGYGGQNIVGFGWVPASVGTIGVISIHGGRATGVIGSWDAEDFFPVDGGLVFLTNGCAARVFC